MMFLLQFVFWLSLVLVLHTYLFYPLLLNWLGRDTPAHATLFARKAELPQVSVLMALHNEESVVVQKIESLLAQDYPQDKISFFLGSDCSVDQTNALIQTYANKYPQIHFFPFQNRQGKPGVINFLAREAEVLHPIGADHVFLITDANVMLAPSTVYHLVRHFKDEAIAIVDAHMIHTGMKKDGISHSENQYISTEVKLKHLEGKVWGKMIGPFGGCYTIRSDFFTQVPSNFLVDDFFITMQAFEKGGQVINDLEAVCYEAVSHDWREEFRRKSRISTGNFQNLFLFSHLWWPPIRPLAFAFFSHKVLRWITPFCIVFLAISTIFLAMGGNSFYQVILGVTLLGAILLPILDLSLTYLKINVIPIRHIRYFLLMNAALLLGFFRYIRGVKSSIWEPPKRS